MFSPICLNNFYQFERLKKKKKKGFLKRNCDKYSLKKFVDSEFKIGETLVKREPFLKIREATNQVISWFERPTCNPNFNENLPIT